MRPGVSAGASTRYRPNTAPAPGADGGATIAWAYGSARKRTGPANPFARLRS
jgi:hypothetical protein